MQGLVNLATAAADAIAVALPALCYLAALACFMFTGWTLWTFAEPHRRSHHSWSWMKPWVPFVSLLLCGAFAGFPKVLTMANVSLGSGMAVSLTSYAASTPPSASGVLGATPQVTVVNVVTLFQKFFQSFGAACIFWAMLRWRAIVNGRAEGSPTACGVQFIFGVLCINVVTVAQGVVALFSSGSAS